MALDVICRYLCMSLLTICWNGFSFSESDFRQRLLGSEASTETFSDFSKSVFWVLNIIAVCGCLTKFKIFFKSVVSIKGISVVKIKEFLGSRGSPCHRRFLLKA